MVGVTINDPRTALKASVAALIAGEVLFPDVNGNIIQDTNLFWDNTNKRLGIANQSPSKALHIKTTSDDSIRLETTSATGVSRLELIGPSLTIGASLICNQANGITVLGSTNNSLGTGSLQLQCGNQGGTIKLFGGPVGIVADPTLNTPTHVFQLTSSDDAAKTTTNAWTVTSDKRLKKNITPFIDGLAVLLQLNPINFQFTGDGGTPKDVQGIGLAAQDIENITPYMIRKTKGKIKDTDLVETDIYKMNNHALVYILVNAVKELEARLSRAGL